MPRTHQVFCGRAPHRGTETCAIVEAMASLEQAFSVLGDPSLADRLEALAFNALPAALTDDMWTHVYVQQANSVFAGDTHPPLSEEQDPSRRRHWLHYRHVEGGCTAGLPLGSLSAPSPRSATSVGNLSVIPRPSLGHLSATLLHL